MGMRSLLLQYWRALAGVLVLLLAALALQHEFHHLTWSRLTTDLAALPLPGLVACVGFSLSSYALLTVFDWQGLASVGKHVPWPRVLGTSFTANALGHSLGMTPLTGGTVRLRSYGDAGFTAADVAQVVFRTSSGFALGVWALTGVALSLAPAHLASVLPGSDAAWRSAGIVELVALAAVFVLLGRTPRPVNLRGFSITLPARHQALLTLAVSVTELGCASAALYVLLPADAAISFPAFLAAYVIAILAGIVSTVPGGLGVFEWTLLRLLPQLPHAQLFACAVAYRAAYYALPLLIAIGLVSVAVLGPRARRFGALATAAVPALASLGVFAAGAWLLLAGSLPVPRESRGVTPLPLLEFSHLAGSLAGVALLVLADGIRRRSRGAWWLTELLLAGAVVAALLRSDPRALVAALVALAAALYAARRHFVRPAALLEAPFSSLWWRNVGLVLVGTAWLFLFAFRHVPYQHELWWQFELAGDAPRALRALLAAVVALAGLGLWQLLRPTRRLEAGPTADELDALAPAVAAATETQANLVWLGDKAVLRMPGTQGFLMYQRTGDSLVSMGDPVGDDAARAALRWAFRELAHARGLHCVFYQIGRTDLHAYLDLGLSVVKIGEEAVVDLANFRLEGKARADLRQSRNRGLREGLGFQVVDAADVGPWLDRIGVISEEWLARKAGTEKGFSLGRFDPEYLRRCPLALVLRAGEPVAFANLWLAPASGELSIDLMRYASAAPKGVMDFLLVELMLWGRAQGYRWFNLGMAPLSGMASHPLAARWQRLFGFVAGHGERFYGFEGLRRYKAKFEPEWRPRYLAAPGGLRLPGILLDLTRLISGGVRGVLAQD